MASAVAHGEDSKLERIITRRGDQLVDGEEAFRFISFNVPNLQLIEDNFAPGAPTAWRWPDEFEIADAFRTIQRAGGQVARTYVLSVRRAGSDMGDHVYVRGPGAFNEEAFRTLDAVLDLAGRHGVRVIVPLVDGWSWQGGRAEYAAFRGKQPDDFWTDEQVMADFEATIRFVLTRVNTRTGVAYRDDPAVLAWETGNELDCPQAWTRRMAATIKRYDAKHLVVDGGSWRAVRAEMLEDPNVDVVATHHYPNLDNSSDYVPGLAQARAASRGKRPYFVGEFGFAPPADVRRVCDAVIAEGASGALIWSLRFHNRDGGFYWHWEPAGGGAYKAYHWPGFPSGDAYAERETLALVRGKAFEIRGLAPPTVAAPVAPKLLPIAHPGRIAWQGSAGAEWYVVQRAPAADGPWQTIAPHVDDAAVQYRPLFSDDSAEPGAAYFYRVVAANSAGDSPPSEPVGPVRPEHRLWVDECRDFSRTASHSAGVRLASGDDRRRREDMHRLLLPAGEQVVYELPAPLSACQGLGFALEDAATLVVEVSSDGRTFAAGGSAAASPDDRGGDYNYLPRLDLRAQCPGASGRFVRLSASGGSVELGWLELAFGSR